MVKEEQEVSPQKRRALKLVREFMLKDINLSIYDGGIIISLEDVVAKMTRFIEDDLQFSKDRNDLNYKSGLTLGDFYSKKTDIAKSIIDVGMLLKVSKPHLKYLHSDIPRLFRETLKSIEIDGKKPAVYQLLNALIEYEYEIVSALTSGQSSTLLESVDMEFLDALKMYREALKSIDSKKWMAYVVIQQLVKHSGGEAMTAKELAAKTGFNESTIRDAMSEIFDKCKEILVVGQQGGERTIKLPSIFAKYELMKQ